MKKVRILKKAPNGDFKVGNIVELDKLRAAMFIKLKVAELAENRNVAQEKGVK